MRRPRQTRGGELVAIPVGSEGAAGGSVLAARFLHGASEQRVEYRARPGPLTDGADPLLVAGLIPALASGARLRVHGRVSGSLLRGARRAQEILCAWHPEYRRVPVEVDEVAEGPAPAGRGVGAFFSGGVDSYYTLSRHADEITHLIFVKGFDIPLEMETLGARVGAVLRGAACELGKELIEVETNVRAFGRSYASWDRGYHGAALASVAHLLAPRLHKIYLPASYGRSYLFPYGSHPELDSSWSSDQLQIVHDGEEATRFEKVKSLSAWKLVQQTLRVCFELDGSYNCGRCAKCLWTMAFLRACDALDQVGTFGRPLDLELLRRHPPTIPDERARFLQALGQLERSGRDVALAAAIRDCLDLQARREARQRRALHARVRRRVQRWRARGWAPEHWLRRVYQKASSIGS